MHGVGDTFIKDSDDFEHGLNERASVGERVLDLFRVAAGIHQRGGVS